MHELADHVCPLTNGLDHDTSAAPWDAQYAPVRALVNEKECRDNFCRMDTRKLLACRPENATVRAACLELLGNVLGPLKQMEASGSLLPQVNLQASALSVISG